MPAYPDRSGSRNANWRGGFESSCTQCGNRVWVKPSRADRQQRFCCKECHRQWMSRHVRANLASGWTGGDVECACQRCGAAFSVSKGEKKRGGGRYCSMACFGALRKLPMTEERASRRRIDQHMRGMMHASLKGGKAGRSWTTLVPYGIDLLIKHLLATMPDGYGWSDFIAGRLHIDHKIPRRAFNYTAPEDYDFQRCWALKNLQLLPVLENLKKGARLSEPFQPALL